MEKTRATPGPHRSKLYRYILILPLKFLWHRMAPLGVHIEGSCFNPNHSQAHPEGRSRIAPPGGAHSEGPRADPRIRLGGLERGGGTPLKKPSKPIEAPEKCTDFN